jgi:hypothetical protein
MIRGVFPRPFFLPLLDRAFWRLWDERNRKTCHIFNWNVINP